MKEAFEIAVANTKRRRDEYKENRNQKSKLQQIEVNGRMLVCKINGRGGTEKAQAFS